MSNGKPQYTLYSPLAIALASFFGIGILIGGILMAINYHRVRRPFLVGTTVLFSVLAQILFFLLLFRVFPGSDNPMPGLISCLLTPIIMYVVSRAFQGEMVHAHRTGGGRLAF